MDQVFRVQLVTGSCCFVKYAGDSIGNGTLGKPLKHKPRRRLATERRTLKRLAKYGLDSVNLPRIILFDKSSWSLVLSEVCPGGRSLQNAFEAGVFDPGVARSVGYFLATCHTAPETIKPVWGDEATDRQHWLAMLSLRTTNLCSSATPVSVCRNLATLAASSRSASVRRIFILDLKPGNIYSNGHQTGITDFELASTTGDPAYDLGQLFAHYLFWGLVTQSSQLSLSAIDSAVRAYSGQAAVLWPDVRNRVAAFTGAGILHCLAVNQCVPACFEKVLSNAAHSLLLTRQDSSVSMTTELARVFYPSGEPSCTGIT